jgi:translocation and assembly module TamA
MRARALLPLLLAGAGCATEQANGRPWVHKVQFEGVRHVNKSDLKGKIAVQATSWVPLARKKYLDPYAVDLDVRRIEAYYAAHGYFAAKVTRADVTPRGKQHDSVDVKFVVDEGQPTRIASLTTNGLRAIGVGAQAAEKRLSQRLARGSTFDHDKYLDAKSRLDTRLQALGFAWAKISGEVDVDRDRYTADIKLDVNAGPKAQFGGVTVRGSQRIEPRLVVIHAEIPRGKPFDPQRLEVARGRLYNLGVFSSVKVEYEHDAARPDVANVVITVQDGKLHELRFGGGINFELQRYDAHLSFNYFKHSFLGGLRSLELRVEPGWVFLLNDGASGAAAGGPTNGPSLTAIGTFVQPDVIGRLTDLDWTVGYDVGIDYAYQYHGPRTSLGLKRPLWNHRVLLSLSYNLQFLMFFNTVPSFQDNPALATQLFGYTNPYRVGWWQQGVQLDLRDRPLDAHQGAYFGATAEEGGVYAAGAFQYEKLLGDLRLYAPLGKRLTLAARGELGQIFVQGTTGSPITRRFYLGGPNTHRGFNYNRLSLQVPSGINGTPNLPIGGDQMLLLSAELRLNLVRLFGNWLGIDGFFDAGDVAAPSTEPQAYANLVAIVQAQCPPGVTPRLPTSVQLNHLHYATGGGLRYKTIIGTVRADVGVRLNRLSHCEPDGTPNPDPNSPVAFHISIGEAF